MTDRLFKALYFCIIDSINKHKGMRMVWEAVPKHNERNKEIVRIIVNSVLSKSKDNIKEALLKEVTEIFSHNIFWETPKDFLEILDQNIEMTLIRLKNAL